MSVKFTKSQLEYIMKFLEDTSGKFSIDESSLKNFWEVHLKDQIKEVDYEKYLTKLKKIELVDICKEKGLKHTGNKKYLVDLILKSNTGINKTIEKFKHIVTIKKNKYNNYEHLETKLVFDNNTKMVIGKQEDDGVVNLCLSNEDIELCNKYKFKYNLPEILEFRKKVGDKTKEVEEEDEEVEEEVEEEDEEVEEEVEEEEVEEEEEEEEED